MSALNDLISQIQDESLRNRIQPEVDKLAKQKKFGLVFEEHLPECTLLYDIPVKKSETAEFSVEDLVSVAEFGEAIYPCLKLIESFGRGQEKRYELRKK